MSARPERVPFSLGRAVLIAGNTFLEARRQKLFNFLLLLAVGLVAGVVYFQGFDFGSSELKFIFDFGMGALVFFGSALTITTAAQLFFSEIEGRTALTLLAKPVWRTEFVLGKFLGAWAVVGVFCALLTGLLAGLLWFRENSLMAANPDAFTHGRIIDYGDVMVAGTLQWLKFGVLTAATLLVASFASTNLYTVALGFFVLVICHLQAIAHQAYARLEESSHALRLVIETLARIFPNFQLFNLADQVGTSAGIDGLLALRVAGYALAYMVVFLGLAVVSFSRREI
jgi:ABC-type transport system involved in multi-copper enzyme maturation permease subunit